MQTVKLGIALVRRFAPGFSAAALLWLCHVHAALALDLLGPYLTSLRPDEATIVCHTAKEAVLTLEFRSTGNGSQTCGQLSQKPSVRHLFRLRGLAPETRYKYRIKALSGWGSSNGELTEWWSFRTPSVVPKPFTFIVYGDSRGGRSSSARHRALASHFLEHSPSFVVSMGDLILGGEKASSSMFSRDWTQSFFTPLNGIFQTVPYYLVVGNHDQDSENALKGARIAFPYLEKSCYYSFQYQGASFVVLHVANRMKEFQAQKQWLVNELRKAGDDDWRIVFLHVSPFTNGKYKDVKWTLAGREDFLKTCVQNKVDLVFSGHDHSYQRFHHLKTEAADPHSTLFVVTALAGTNPYKAVKDKYSAITINNVDHFCVVDVSEDSLTLRAFDSHNRVMDKVSLSKKRSYRGMIWKPGPWR